MTDKLTNKYHKIKHFSRWNVLDEYV